MTAANPGTSPTWRVAEARTRIPADLVASHDGNCSGSGDNYHAGCSSCRWLGSDKDQWLRAQPGGKEYARSASRKSTQVVYGKRRSRSEKTADADFAKRHGQGKFCVGCTMWLPANAFYVHLVETDGRSRQCKPCTLRDRERKPWSKRTPGWIDAGLDPDVCAYLGVPIGPGNRDVDHFVPKASPYFGPDEPWNLVPASPLANRGIAGKSDKNPWEYMADACPDRIPFFINLMRDQPQVMDLLASANIPDNLKESA